MVIVGTPQIKSLNSTVTPQTKSVGLQESFLLLQDATFLLLQDASNILISTIGTSNTITPQIKT